MFLHPMRWTARGKAFRAAIVLGVCSLLLTLGEVGVRGFGVGLALAVVPAPFYVLLALWLDRFEPEPRQLLASTFLWGACVATFLAIIANASFELMATASLGKAAEGLAAVVSAPVVEETAKGAVLVILFATERGEFDNVTDGIVYAALAGLGFAMVENIEYYGNAFKHGLQSSVGTFLVRGIASPFAHPLFTAMTGAGLGVARETSNRDWKYIAPIIGFLGAILLHFVWNLSAEIGDAFFAAYVLIMVPMFVAVLFFVRASLRRESRIIRSHLQPLVEAGTLAPDELECLCSARGRLFASLTAARRDGLRGWRARDGFHRAATELAFHRWRLERGLVVDGEDAEQTYLEFIERRASSGERREDGLEPVSREGNPGDGRASRGGGVGA